MRNRDDALHFEMPARTYSNNHIDPVSPDVPRAFAAELGVTYPQEYIDLVSNYGGQGFGVENNVLRSTHPTAKEGGFFVCELLLHFNLEIEKGLILAVPFTYDLDAHIYKQGFVPFVVSLGRTFLCFDYRAGPTNPAIVYYEGDSGEDLNEVISPVVEDFDAFLDRLLP